MEDKCFECTSRNCPYNHDEECRFALVHERMPKITERDGCIDFDYVQGKEEEA